MLGFDVQEGPMLSDDGIPFNANSFYGTGGLPAGNLATDDPTGDNGSAIFATGGKPGNFKRGTTIRTSIISGGKSAASVTVSSVAWKPHKGGIVILSASVPAAARVGDILVDSATNSFLIQSLGTNWLGLTYFDYLGEPATGAGSIDEAYTSLTAWENDLTDTIVYEPEDDAIGEAYADALFNQSLTLNTTTTSFLASITLTAAAEDRHDGTGGTGTRVTFVSATGLGISGGVIGKPITVSWFEFDGNSQAYYLLTPSSPTSSDTPLTISNNLIYSPKAATAAYGIYAQQSNARIINNIIYDITQSSNECRALHVYTPATYDCEICNNTIFNVEGDGDAYGIYIESDNAVTTLKNNLVMDPTSIGTPQCYYPSSYTNVDHATNASSEGSSPDGASYRSWVSAAQFISTGTGTEDLHLISDADALRVGTDLGTTPAGVEIDIDGYDRDAGTDSWDIGADSYTPVRTSDVKTTIVFGGKTATSVRINAVRWNANEGTGVVSLDSLDTPPDIGDTLTDFAGNTYLITAYHSPDLFDLEIQQFDTTLQPIGGKATMQECYQTPTAWADDQYNNSTMYQSTDTATGEMHADATFALTTNVYIEMSGLNSAILTAATADRHDGTAGTGVVLDATNITNTSFVFYNYVKEGQTFVESWFEITNGAPRGSGAFYTIENASITRGLVYQQNLLIHDSRNGAHPTLEGIQVDGTAPTVGDSIIYVTNCIIYDIYNSYAVGASVYGINSDTPDNAEIYNNTVYKTVSDAAAGVCYGLYNKTAALGTIKNNYVAGTSGALTGSDFGGLFTGTATNGSEDSSSPDGSSYHGWLPADQFVSTGVGSEDLRLVYGADCIGTGTDLGTTPTDVEIDIQGYDRDTGGSAWDVGADTYDQDLYWVNDGGDNDWSNTQNWSYQDGGPGGMPVPTANEDVFFTSTTTDSCTLSGTSSCKDLSVQAGYSGTLDLGDSGYTFSIAGNVTLAGSGTFDWGNSTVTIAGNLNMASQTTVTSDAESVELTGTSKNLTLGEHHPGINDLEISGSITDATVYSQVPQVNDLVVSGSFSFMGDFATFRVANTVNVTGTLTLGGLYGTVGICSFTVPIGGVITGTGGENKLRATSTNVSGSINVAYLEFANVNGTLAGLGTYTCDLTAKIDTAASYTLTVGQGPSQEVTISGDITFTGPTGGDSLTIDTGTNGATLTCQGSFTATNNVVMSATGGLLKFTGLSGGLINVNGISNTFGPVEIAAIPAQGIFTLDSGIVVDSFVGTSGDFNLAGYTVTSQGAVDINGATNFRFWNGVDDSMFASGAYGKFLVGQGGSGNLTLDGQSGTQLGIHDLNFDYDNTSTGTAMYCDVLNSLGPAGLSGSGADIDATDPSNTEVGGTNTGWDFGAEPAANVRYIVAPFGIRPNPTNVGYRVIFGD